MTPEEQVVIDKSFINILYKVLTTNFDIKFVISFINSHAPFISGKCMLKALKELHKRSDKFEEFMNTNEE